MIPIPWLAAGAALIAVSALAGLQTIRLANERAAHADTRAAWQAQAADGERLGRLAEAQAREIERRRAESVAEVSAQAEAQNERLRRDLLASRGTADRLRRAVADTAARCRSASTDPAPAGSGETARATGDVLAELHSRIDEAAGIIAAHADAARVAGQACEQAYEGVR